MNIVMPEVYLEMLNPGYVYRKIEKIGRLCYKSEDKITVDSAVPFIKNLVKRGHESVLEHVNFTARFICDRGVTHELVRHRIASYSQESTRYCNYADGKFDGGVSYIHPFFWDDDTLAMMKWRNSCEMNEMDYLDLVGHGIAPQQARDVLNNSLKTEIYMTTNVREWRHMLRLRCSPAAHPQMRQVAIPLLHVFNQHYPVLFDDVKWDTDFPKHHFAKASFEYFE